MKKCSVLNKLKTITYVIYNLIDKETLMINGFFLH